MGLDVAGGPECTSGVAPDSSDAVASAGVEHRFVETGGIRIHVVTAGPPTGEPVVLLHGFPETWYEWRHAIPELAERYRVIVPDTRGFGESDKPAGPYTRSMLAADIAGVLDALGVARTAVVGHDWGGIIAFKLAVDWPGRVSKLALLDTLCTVWHPGAVHGFWFKADPRPEVFFAKYHAEFIERMLSGGSQPALPGWPESPWVGRTSVALGPAGWATPADLATYQRAFADPAAHRAAISYYRDALAFYRVTPAHRFDATESHEALSRERVGAAWEAGLENDPLGAEFLDFGPEDRAKRYPGPTLWMYADPHARRAAGEIPSGNPFADQFRAYFPDLRGEPVPGAGHFFPEEKPDFTNARLRRFLDTGS